MSPRTFALAAAALPLIAGLAAPLPASAQDERYQLERTPDGYVRLDTRTGAMSLCTERDARLTCRPAMMDEHGASDGGSLQGRIEDLERRVTALERQETESGLPDEEEFERSLSYMERFFRSFMGIAREFDRDTETEAEPAPDRT